MSVKKALRVLALLSAMLMLTTLLLTSCSGGTEESSGGTSSGSSGSGDDAEPVTIRMAGEGQLLVTLLGKKYTELHPNVTIEYYNPDGQGYVNNEMLIAWSAAGTLPDIVNIDNPEIAYQNDILVDLTDYFNNDPDKDLLYEDIVQYCTTNDQLLMIPYQLWFSTVMVNQTLIEENNLDVPDYDWTVDEFVNIVKKLTVPPEMLGTYDGGLWKYLIPNYDPELESGGYRRSDQSWVIGEAFQASVDVMADLVLNDYTAYERLNATDNSDGTWANWYALSNEIIGVDDPWTAWQQGTVATWFESTYWSNWDVGNDIYGGQEWDCYPIPVWNEGDTPRIAVINDNYAITRGCENPDVAYDVLKFFTYSKEGFDARMDIWENYDAEALKAEYPEMAEANLISDFFSMGLSPIDDQEVRDKWAEMYNAKPGIVYMIDHLADSNMYMDGGKTIPGFSSVFNDILSDAVNNQIFTGEKTAADLLTDLQSRADAAQAEILASLQKVE
ncbi:MAG TPA: extracellular solute-binding protein [Firmicutes bacterium]|nr:extracellular solute-binding protein [Bacillota bacterium]